MKNSSFTETYKILNTNLQQKSRQCIFRTQAIKSANGFSASPSPEIPKFWAMFLKFDSFEGTTHVRLKCIKLDVFTFAV